MRSQHWPIDYQAAGPAVALMVSVTITSLIKALVLKRVLKAPVSGYRWPLVWAALAAILVGTIFTSLPKSMEWAELVIGIPAIAATYLFIIWRWAFGPEDRTLFRKMPPGDEGDGEGVAERKGVGGGKG